MKKLAISITSVLILSFVAGLFPGCAIGFFQKYDDHYYYSTSESTLIVDSVWIHPLVRGKEDYFVLPPFFISGSEKAPYQVGLMFVDYENTNKCHSVEISEFSITSNGETHDIIKGEPKYFSPFYTYVERVDHVKLECLIDAGDWLKTDNESDLEFRIKFKLEKETGTVEKEYKGTLHPQEIEGYGTALDILSA